MSRNSQIAGIFVGFLGIICALIWKQTYPNKIDEKHFVSNVDSVNNHLKASYSPTEVQSTVNFVDSIVTTWIGIPNRMAYDWINFHLATGFGHLFIFFDDPEADSSLISDLRASNLSQHLTIVESDKNYRSKYWDPDNVNPNEPEFQMLPSYGVHQSTEAMARQALHATRAAKIASDWSRDCVVAPSSGDSPLDHPCIRWLLHLDSDELFVPTLPDLDRSSVNSNPNVDDEMANRYLNSAKALLDLLSASNITHAQFLNDEATWPFNSVSKSQKSKDALWKAFTSPSVSPFRDGMNFVKINPNDFEAQKNPKARAFQSNWSAQRGVNSLFLGYSCGKGSVNIPQYHQWWETDTSPQPKTNHVYAEGVTSFYPSREVIEKEMEFRAIKDYDQAAEFIKGAIENRGFKYATIQYSAKIIHFINFSLPHVFLKWRRKPADLLAFNEEKVSEDMRRKFQRFRPAWRAKEEQPAHEFYLQVSKIVNALPLPSNGDEVSNHEAFSKKQLALLADKFFSWGDTEKAIHAGVAYRLSYLPAFISTLSPEGVLEKKKREREQTKKKETTIADGASLSHLSRCPVLAPEYFCDPPSRFRVASLTMGDAICCQILKQPIMTYLKRLSGYTRFGVLEWWKLGSIKKGETPDDIRKRSLGKRN